MIVGGFKKGRLEFDLVIKPQNELISVKKGLEVVKMVIKDINSLIDFLPLLTKEKGLYNIAYPKSFETGSMG